MAIIRNSASALRKGRVGNTTYYVSGQRQIARVSQNSSNYGETARRTEAMQERRARWGNLVNFYKASKNWMRYAYETKSAKQSDYNRFMQVNLNTSVVYLTKDQAALGACVVEPFAISQGSLRSIYIAKESSYYVTDIELGNLVIDDNTTVGVFSAQVIAYNNGVRAGYQLSFISYQQWTDFNGIPQLTCTAYEVTLDPTSEAKLRDYLPEFCATNRGTKLGTSLSISAGAFTYMWSYTDGGITRVSTQTLINNNAGMIASFSSNAQRQLAIESYGLDTDSFLMSGSTPQVPTPATQAIGYIHVEGVGDFEPGMAVPIQVSALSAQTWRVYMARDIQETNVRADIITSNGLTIPSATGQWLSGRIVDFTWPTAASTGYIATLNVYLDGVLYVAQFSAPTTQEED